MLDAFLPSLPGGRGTARGFSSLLEPQQRLEEAHAAGAAAVLLWQDGGADEGEGACPGQGSCYFPHALKVALPGSCWEGCVLTWLERPINHAEICHPWHSPLCLLDTDPLPSRACAAPHTVCAVGCSGSPPSPACGSSLFWGQHVPAARHCGAVRGGHHHHHHLLLFPGLLQARAALLVLWSISGGCIRVCAPPTSFLHAAGQPHTQHLGPGPTSPVHPFPASQIQPFTVRTRAGEGGHSSEWEGAGTHVHTAGELSEGVLHTHRLGRQQERGRCHSSGSGSKGAVSTCACTCRYRPCSWDTCVSRP